MDYRWSKKKTMWDWTKKLLTHDDSDDDDDDDDDAKFLLSPLSLASHD